MGELIKKEFNGIEVNFKGMEQVNLTDMWKATGSNPDKRPNDWLALASTKELINAACKKFNTVQNGIVKTVRGGRGGGGGTWAHRVVAVSYAGYLSAEMQVWINQVFLERLQEERNPDLITERMINTYKRKGFSDRRIELRFKSIHSNKIHREKLMQHEVDKFGQIICANNINVGITGVQKKTYLKNNGHQLNAVFRDCVTDPELAAITLAEILADEKIEKEAINGNHDCSKICFQVARTISDAMKNI